jgi:hypothetical protein
MLSHHFFNGHTIWFNPHMSVWCVKPGYCTHCVKETATFATCDAAHAAIGA